MYRGKARRTAAKQVIDNLGGLRFVREALTKAPRGSKDAAGRQWPIGPHVAEMVTQLLSWEGLGDLQDSWIHKVREEWYDKDARLTERRLRTARRVGVAESLWKERGPGDVIRTRTSVEPRPREEWQAVAVDLSGSGLVRAQVDAARERIRGNTRRSASTAAERFWELSGGVLRCGICGCALSPHTTDRAGGRKAPYYRCFQRHNSGPRDCTNTKTLPAPPLEEAVWRKVRLLLEEPERVMAAYDAYVELRRRRLRGDPDREALELSEKLEKLERRSNLIDMGADGTIGHEDLRTKLEEADEERDSLRRALREAAGRGQELERLTREREVLADRFSAMRGMGLRHLAPRDRRAVYDALRVMAYADGRGDVRITGVFDADITELLPASWALAKANAREYDAGRNVSLPTLHKGVVSVDHPRRET